MRMLVLLCLSCAWLVAGCSLPRLGGVNPDFEPCRAEAEQVRGLLTRRHREAHVDRCLEQRGWRPSAACKREALEGTAMCDYEWRGEGRAPTFTR